MPHVRLAGFFCWARLIPSCNHKCGTVGAHPRVRPQFRADTWVRPYKKIVVCLQIGMRSRGMRTKGSSQGKSLARCASLLLKLYDC
jgi:hypothetical protein